MTSHHRSIRQVNASTAETIRGKYAIIHARLGIHYSAGRSCLHRPPGSALKVGETPQPPCDNAGQFGLCLRMRCSGSRSNYRTLQPCIEDSKNERKNAMQTSPLGFPTPLRLTVSIRVRNFYGRCRVLVQHSRLRSRRSTKTRDDTRDGFEGETTVAILEVTIATIMMRDPPLET